MKVVLREKKREEKREERREKREVSFVVPNKQDRRNKRGEGLIEYQDHILSIGAKRKSSSITVRQSKQVPMYI